MKNICDVTRDLYPSHVTNYLTFFDHSIPLKRDTLMDGLLGTSLIVLSLHQVWLLAKFFVIVLVIVNWRFFYSAQAQKRSRGNQLRIASLCMHLKDTTSCLFSVWDT